MPWQPLGYWILMWHLSNALMTLSMSEIILKTLHWSAYQIWSVDVLGSKLTHVFEHLHNCIMCSTLCNIETISNFLKGIFVCHVPKKHCSFHFHGNSWHWHCHCAHFVNLSVQPIPDFTIVCATTAASFRFPQVAWWTSCKHKAHFLNLMASLHLNLILIKH